MSEDDSASASSTPKKGAKDTNRKKKMEEMSPVLPAANQESPVCVKRAKTARDNNRDLGLCRYEVLTCSYMPHLLNHSLSDIITETPAAKMDPLLVLMNLSA